MRFKQKKKTKEKKKKKKLEDRHVKLITPTFVGRGLKTLYLYTILLKHSLIKVIFRSPKSILTLH